jgi:hypothetical protein
MAREIALTHGTVAIVDDEDYELVSAHEWQLSKLRYATTGYAYSRTAHKKMAQFLMNPPKGMAIDHANGNGLDNRRCNLRICSKAQNCQNRRKQERKTSSRFKGVQRTLRGTWRVTITAKNHQYHVGTFKLEENAARAYDDAARQLHGQFACVNFARAGEAWALEPKPLLPVTQGKRSGPRGLDHSDGAT